MQGAGGGEDALVASTIARVLALPRRARRALVLCVSLSLCLVLLGLSFVAVTLFFPKGIGGLFDYLVRKPS